MPQPGLVEVARDPERELVGPHAEPRVVRRPRLVHGRSARRRRSGKMMSVPPAASGIGLSLCQPSITGTTQSCGRAMPVDPPTSRRGRLEPDVRERHRDHGAVVGAEELKFDTYSTSGPKSSCVSFGPLMEFLSGPDELVGPGDVAEHPRVEPGGRHHAGLVAELTLDDQLLGAGLRPQRPARGPPRQRRVEGPGISCVSRAVRLKEKAAGFPGRPGKLTSGLSR